MTGFLSRLAERSAPAGPRLAPKGLLSRAPAHGDEDDEHGGKPEAGASVNRVSEPDKKDKEQAARAEKKDEEKKAEAKPLRRAGDDEEKPGAKPKEEEAAHRAEKKPDEPDKPAPAAPPKDHKEEEAHALRRSGAKDEDDKGTHRALRRSEAAAEEKNEHKPGEEKEAARAPRTDPTSPEEHDRPPKPEQTRDEKEPNKLTALRREPAAGFVPAAPVGAPSFQQGFGALRPPGPAPDSGFQRPSVQIDHLDVIVQEPASAAPSGAFERSRSIRARYLRKL